MQTTFIKVTDFGIEFIKQKLSLHAKHQEACLANINAWVESVEDRFDQHGLADIVILSSMSNYDREMVIEMPEGTYKEKPLFAVWEMERGGEPIVFVAEADSKKAAEIGARVVEEAPLMESANAADVEAMIYANTHVATAMDNVGWRPLRTIDGYESVVDEIKAAGVKVCDAYVVGAGKPVNDSGVADVLGTDLNDLCSGANVVADVVGSIIENTGCYVTREQYANHVMYVCEQWGEDLSKYASDKLIADIRKYASR